MGKKAWQGRGVSASKCVQGTVTSAGQQCVGHLRGVRLGTETGADCERAGGPGRALPCGDWKSPMACELCAQVRVCVHEPPLCENICACVCVCTFVYVCVCLCMCAYEHVCVHACTCAWVSMCVCACVCTRAWVSMCVACACMCTCVSSCRHACVCVHVGHVHVNVCSCVCSVRVCET